LRALSVLWKANWILLLSRKVAWIRDIKASFGVVWNFIRRRVPGCLRGALFGLPRAFWLGWRGSKRSRSFPRGLFGPNPAWNLGAVGQSCCRLPKNSTNEGATFRQNRTLAGKRSRPIRTTPERCYPTLLHWDNGLEIAGVLVWAGRAPEGLAPASDRASDRASDPFAGMDR